MAAGKEPLVSAILGAEQEALGEIRVHLSHRRFEKNANARAAQIFRWYGMRQTSHQNAVLIYLNTRTRNFVLLADQGLVSKTGRSYWNELSHLLAQDLQSQKLEHALALAVATIGASLKKFFPKDLA